MGHIDDQRVCAEDIAHSLRLNEHDIYAIDILDALASTGLLLTGDFKGLSGDAYYDEVVGTLRRD